MGGIRVARGTTRARMVTPASSRPGAAAPGAWDAALPLPLRRFVAAPLPRYHRRRARQSLMRPGIARHRRDRMESTHDANAPAHAADGDLLADLTEPQRQAVTHVEGPLLVLAGPGSGKTRVITRRIAHLVLGVGLAPWHVLAITFTNKAANEMRQRVGAMLSARQAAAVTLSTFHGFCARVLRRHGHVLGVPPNYTIYDTADQQRAVKQALRDLDVRSENFPPGNVLGTISAAKNELIDVASYAAAAGDFYSRTVARIYRAYQRILEQSHGLDFDDLLMRTVQLMRQAPETLAELRGQYQYVLIDEYQDTNHAQFVLARQLAAEHRNLCVTGDPDQSIYSWRGADIRNILEFERHFPNATVVRLEQNYRSTKRILAAADELIQHNTRRRHKSLWTENEAGERVRIVRCREEHQEATWTAQCLRAAHDDHDVPWGDMAVFYRINALSRVMEEALRDARIPYQIARGTAFFDRKEIKDAVAYLRVLANPADAINLLRIINTPARGISDRTVRALQAAAAAGGDTVVDLLDQAGTVPGIGPRALAAIDRFRDQLGAWRRAVEDPPSTPLRNLVERILDESGLQRHHARDSGDPDADRLANLGELVSAVHQFDHRLDLAGAEPAPLAERLNAYLEQVSLISDVDSVDPEQGSVTLMTLHAAKGLEFTLAVILGMEDGLLPHSQSQQAEKQLEEERRLCFVGITRARRWLALSHTCVRTVFGRPQATIPSRFLNEIAAESTERIDLTDTEDDMVRDVDEEDAWDDDPFEPGPAASRRQLPPGTKVQHPQFGLGRVLAVDRFGGQSRVRVRFAHGSTKTLVLEYARLQVVT